MSDSWHKDEGELGFLPRSELNPLMNPLLERHLGRWAEVYFTSPPEKREQAVEELLLELQREANQPQETPELQAEGQLDQATQSNEIPCPKCQYQNLASQKFCGACGSPLSGEAIAETAKEKPAPETLDVSEVPSLTQVSHAAENDLQWLRGKAFSQWDEAEAPVPNKRKWLVAAFGVACLLAAFAYIYSISRNHSAPASPANALIPPAASQPESHASASAGSIPPQKIPIENHNPAHVRKAPAPQPSSANLDSAGNAGGSQELLLAKRSLEGTAGVRDSASAAKLLWKAVGKQNVQAALLLSDLYLRGDGVARNCDQARLLLIAAAKKGGTAAAQQLRSFDAKGCQ